MKGAGVTQALNRPGRPFLLASLIDLQNGVPKLGRRRKKELLTHPQSLLARTLLATAVLHRSFT